MRRESTRLLIWALSRSIKGSSEARTSVVVATGPNSRCASKVNDWFTVRVRSLMWIALNPSRSTEMAYGPGATVANQKMPSSLVEASREIPVCVFCRVTLAPLTNCSLGSRITPPTLAVCARSTDESERQQSRHTKMSRKKMHLIKSTNLCHNWPGTRIRDRLSGSLQVRNRPPARSDAAQFSTNPAKASQIRIVRFGNRLAVA